MISGNFIHQLYFFEFNKFLKFFNFKFSMDVRTTRVEWILILNNGKFYQSFLRFVSNIHVKYS